MRDRRSAHLLGNSGMTATKYFSAERRQASTASISHFAVDSAPIGRLRAFAQSIRLRRRQHQPHSGAPAIMIVNSGVLMLSSGGPQGRPVIIEILYPGDVFITNEISAIPDPKLSASTSAECWRVPLAAFEAELSRDGKLAADVIARQSAQRSRLHLHVTVLASLTSEERVAALLIEAGCRLGTEPNREIVFDMPWSRTEVAEYLSLNADTLSRIMSKLTHAAVIARLSRSQLVIRDWEALQALTPLAEAVIAQHRPAWRT